MDGTDIPGTQLLDVFDHIPAVFHDSLPFVEDGNAVALDLFQQFQVAFGIEGRVNTYAQTAGLGSLADMMQSFYNLTALGLVGRPVVTTAAEGQESHLCATHLVHRVETVSNKGHIIVALRQILGIETAHGDGTNLNT